jgi:DNA polymerase zeta
MLGSGSSAGSEAGGTAGDSRSLLSSPLRGTVPGLQGPTPAHTYQFKLRSQNVSATTALQVQQHLTLLCMECHADSEALRESNPSRDPLRAIVFVVCSDDEFTSQSALQKRVLYTREPAEAPSAASRVGLPGMSMEAVADEVALVRRFIEVVASLDPDVLVGYEVQLASWGYLLERGACLGIDLSAELSRLYEQRAKKESDPHGYFSRHTSELMVPGRVVLNVWRLLRHELALTSYTLENTAFHVLHRRLPRYSQPTLRDWYNGPVFRHR